MCIVKRKKKFSDLKVNLKLKIFYYKTLNFLRILLILSIMRYLILILSVISIIVAAKMIPKGIRFLFETIKFLKSTKCVPSVFLYFISFNSFNNRSISWQSYYVYSFSMECSKSRRYTRAKFMHASYLIIRYVGYAVNHSL